MATNYQIWVLDLNKWDVWFTGYPVNYNDNGFAKSLKDWANQEHADLCWNLAFFNMGTTKNLQNKCAYRNLQYIKDAKGNVLGDGGTSLKLHLPNGCECSG